MKFKLSMLFHLTVRKWNSGMGYCVMNIHVLTPEHIFTNGLSGNTLSLFGCWQGGRKEFEILVTESEK